VSFREGCLLKVLLSPEASIEASAVALREALAWQ